MRTTTRISYIMFAIILSFGFSCRKDPSKIIEVSNFHEQQTFTIKKKVKEVRFYSKDDLLNEKRTYKYRGSFLCEEKLDKYYNDEYFYITTYTSGMRKIHLKEVIGNNIIECETVDEVLDTMRHFRKRNLLTFIDDEFRIIESEDFKWDSKHTCIHMDYNIFTPTVDLYEHKQKELCSKSVSINYFLGDYPSQFPDRFTIECHQHRYDAIPHFDKEDTIQNPFFGMEIYSVDYMMFDNFIGFSKFYPKCITSTSIKEYDKRRNIKVSHLLRYILNKATEDNYPLEIYEYNEFDELIRRIEFDYE